MECAHRLFATSILRVGVLLQGALLLALPLATFGCSDEPEAPAGPPPNVVLVVLDTLRADRLGAYGRTPSITPQLDAFAAESTTFLHAYAHAPWTLPSMASLLTSQTPEQHGAGSDKGRFTAVSPASKTLAETFARSGYDTGAITNVLFLGPRFGAMRGFEVLDHVSPRDNRLVRTAESNTDTALRWIGRRGERPFFLLVHYFDAHLTYDPPQPWRERFADPSDRDVRTHVFGDVSEIVAFRRGQVTLDDELIRRLERLYDGEVAYMDDSVGELFDALRERGLLDNTIVVVTSDHGEEFGDHDGFEHGHTLYDELLRVPLIVRRPGATEASGRKSTATARLIDVAPTLLDLAGLSAPDTFTGQSLVPQLDGSPGDDRPVVSVGNMWGPSGRAIRRDRFKLIESAEGELVGLFDREADAGEQVDVSVEHPERVSSMRRELRDQLGPAGGSASAPDAELGEIEREQLRALGYGH